jgi:hypothetical protein
MSTTDSRRLIRNGAVAAIVGATIGAAAGFWSLHRLAPAAAGAAGTPAAPIAIQASSVPRADHANRSSQPRSRAIVSDPQRDNRESDSAAQSTPARATSSAGAAPAASPNPGADDEHVLQRAKALAQRPDVVGLIALRKEVVRRAAERGLADSPSIKSELNELDRRLNEARTLQLKLDADALRKAESNPPR